MPIIYDGVGGGIKVELVSEPPECDDIKKNRVYVTDDCTAYLSVLNPSYKDDDGNVVDDECKYKTVLLNEIKFVEVIPPVTDMRGHILYIQIDSGRASVLIPGFVDADTGLFSSNWRYIGAWPTAADAANYALGEGINPGNTPLYYWNETSDQLLRIALISGGTLAIPATASGNGASQGNGWSGTRLTAASLPAADGQFYTAGDSLIYVLDEELLYFLHDDSVWRPVGEDATVARMDEILEGVISSQAYALVREDGAFYSVGTFAEAAAYIQANGVDWDDSYFVERGVYLQNIQQYSPGVIGQPAAVTEFLRTGYTLLPGVTTLNEAAIAIEELGGVPTIDNRYFFVPPIGRIVTVTRLGGVEGDRRAEIGQLDFVSELPLLEDAVAHRLHMLPTGAAAWKRHEDPDTILDAEFTVADQASFHGSALTSLPIPNANGDWYIAQSAISGGNSIANAVVEYVAGVWTVGTTVRLSDLLSPGYTLMGIEEPVGGQSINTQVSGAYSTLEYALTWFETNAYDYTEVYVWLDSGTGILRTIKQSDLSLVEVPGTGGDKWQALGNVAFVEYLPQLSAAPADHLYLLPDGSGAWKRGSSGSHVLDSLYTADDDAEYLGSGLATFPPNLDSSNGDYCIIASVNVQGVPAVNVFFKYVANAWTQGASIRLADEMPAHFTLMGTEVVGGPSTLDTAARGAFASADAALAAWFDGTRVYDPALVYVWMDTTTGLLRTFKHAELSDLQVPGTDSAEWIVLGGTGGEAREVEVIHESPDSDSSSTAPTFPTNKAHTLVLNREPTDSSDLHIYLRRPERDTNLAVTGDNEWIEIGRFGWADMKANLPQFDSTTQIGGTVTNPTVSDFKNMVQIIMSRPVGTTITSRAPDRAQIGWRENGSNLEIVACITSTNVATFVGYVWHIDEIRYGGGGTTIHTGDVIQQVGGGATSEDDIDSRISSWARAHNPSGEIPDGTVPAAIMRDAEFTAAGVRNLLGLTATEAGNILVGAFIGTNSAGERQITLTRNDGTSTILTLPAAGTTSDADIDDRIATWARANSPSGEIPDATVPSAIMRDAELTPATVRARLGLTAEEANNIVTGAAIVGENLLFQRNDGGVTILELPAGDGRVTSGYVDGTTLNLFVGVGDDGTGDYVAVDLAPFITSQDQFHPETVVFWMHGQSERIPTAYTYTHEPTDNRLRIRYVGDEADEHFYGATATPSWFNWVAVADVHANIDGANPLTTHQVFGLDTGVYNIHFVAEVEEVAVPMAGEIRSVYVGGDDRIAAGSGYILAGGTTGSSLGGVLRAIGPYFSASTGQQYYTWLQGSADATLAGDNDVRVTS